MLTRIHIWITVCVIINGIPAQTIRDTLKAAVFANYDTNVRPYCGNNDAITVTLDMAMRQLIDMKWTDCRLVWNASSHGGISNIIVPYNTLWIPDITLYDNTGETFFGKENFRPNIYSDGTVYYNFPSVVDNRCIVDISRFPYDSQVCKFVFGSWAYHGQEIDFVAKKSNGDLSTLEKNVEWDITSFPAERHVIYYNCCPEPYPDVTFYLKMTRKPDFYVVNILVPYILITGMGFFGFFLPCETGEKVSLEITVMLSLAVFQMLVADSLPPSSDTTPYLAIYFAFSMFLVGYATVIAVLVNNLYYRDNEEIPKIIRILFLDFASKITFQRKLPPTKNKSVRRKDDKTEDKIKHASKSHIKTDKVQQKSSSCLTSLTSRNPLSCCINDKRENVIKTTNKHTDKVEEILEKADDKISLTEQTVTQNGRLPHLPPIRHVKSVINDEQKVTDGVFSSNGVLPSSRPAIHPVSNGVPNDATITKETEEHLDKIEKTLEHIDRKVSRSDEWKTLAMVIDRLACYVFIIAGFSGLVTIFTLLKE